MGVPVVTMNSGGMAELVENGVTGTLAYEPTPGGIAVQLRKTLGDDVYYNTLRENCAKAKDSILSVEAYCDILVEKYHDILNRRK